MNKNKLIATFILILLSFSISITVFFYQTEKINFEMAQMLGLYLFCAFIIFGGIYLYFVLKKLDKK